MFKTCYTRVNPKVVKVVITPEEDGAKSIPMVLLDISGSMAGSRLEHCIKALECFLEKGPIRLITFNHEAQNLGQVERLPKLGASGGTSFKAAFEALRQSEHHGPVIFLTDGEDPKGFKDPRLPTGTQLFSVGIEGESQTQLLIDLAKSSPIPGDYTYFSSRNNNYAAEAELLSTKVRSAPIVFNGKQYYLADRLELYLEDSTTECESSTTAVVDYLAYRTDLLVQQGEKAPLDQIQLLRDEATELFAAAGKMPLIMRKQVRTALQPVYALLGKFYDLRHANMKITNDQLANLALSARNARTSRFAKMAVDRASENEQKIAQQDQRLSDLAAAFDPSSVNLDQECTLSRSSVAELMKDGDCLGVGIQCVPNEVCIADPTRLVLTDIGTSYFGCTQFLEASEWALPNGVTFGQATKILPDSSRVNVSAVLPLYLNDVHWKWAKEYLLRMVGHACCKDPLQGTLRHIVFTYLLAYQRAKTYNTEFHNRMAQEFALVLQHLPNIHPTPEQFCQVENRVTDSVPSFPLLEVAWEVYQCQAPPHYEAMKEEELLRRAKEPKSLVKFPDEWIQSFVTCNAPRSKGDIYSGLRARAIAANRQDVLEKLPSESEDASDRPKFVECATEVEPVALPLQIGSPRRRALIALQAWKCPKSTDLVNYVSYHEWTEEQVNEAWNKYCTEQLQQQRSAALSALINMKNDNSVGEDLVLLQHASLLEWLAILTRSLYVGRNIRRYAEIATDLEHVKMLSGLYDAGTLLGLPSFPVTTLNDELSSWVPSTSKKGHGALYRRWLAKWGQDLLRVFPEISLRSNSVFLAQLFAKNASPSDYPRLFNGTQQEQCELVTELFGLPKGCYDQSLKPNMENMVSQLKKDLGML